MRIPECGRCDGAVVAARSQDTLFNDDDDDYSYCDDDDGDYSYRDIDDGNDGFNHHDNTGDGDDVDDFRFRHHHSDDLAMRI